MDEQKVKLIRTNRLFNNTEYAYASIAPAGSKIVTLAGACPLDNDGKTGPVGSYSGQARQSLENMQTVLDEMGLAIENVISTRVLVASASRDDLVEAWEVVRDYFSDHAVPSTLMGVTALGYGDQLVEIEVTAAIFGSDS